MINAAAVAAMAAAAVTETETATAAEAALQEAEISLAADGGRTSPRAEPGWRSSAPAAVDQRAALHC